MILRDGQPTTEGDQPINPAVLVMLEGFLPDTNPARLTLAPGPTHDSILFLGESPSTPPTRGSVQLSKSFSPGWKGWSIRLVSYEPHARLETVTLPSQKQETTPGRPALHAHLRSSDGTIGPARWIASGTSAVLTSAGAASTSALDSSFKIFPSPSVSTPLMFRATPEPRSPQTSSPQSLSPTRKRNSKSPLS